MLNNHHFCEEDRIRLSLIMSALLGRKLNETEIQPYDSVNLKEANRRYNEITKNRFMSRNCMTAHSIVQSTLIFFFLSFVMFIYVYNFKRQYMVSCFIIQLLSYMIFLDKHKLRMISSIVQIKHYNIDVKKSSKSIDFFVIMKIRNKKNRKVRISVLPKEQATILRNDKVGEEYYFYFGSNECINEMIYDYINGGKLSLSEIAYSLTVTENYRIFRRVQ